MKQIEIEDDEVRLVDKQVEMENSFNNYKNPENTLINRDKYLDQIFRRMKFTRSHFYLVLSIFLIRSVEGTEILSLSLASEMIETSFNLKQHSSSVINAIILSGNTVGCLISLLISNKYPRKTFIKIGSGLIISCGLASILCHNIILFVIFRHIVNIGIGILIAGSLSLIAESMNSNYRGFMLNLILVSSSFGEIFISSLLGILVDLENPHEWSRLFLLSMTPIILGTAFIPFYPDSMHYYIEKGDYSKAYLVCKTYFSNFGESEDNFTKIMNNPGGKICHDKDVSLSITNTSEKNKSNSKTFLYIVIMLFASLNSFLTQGIRYILPKTLTHVYHLKMLNHNEDLLKENYKYNAAVVSLELKITSTTASAFSFLTGILIETSFLQRLRLLRLGVFTSLTLSTLAYIIKKQIDIFACALRAVTTIQDQIIDIYSSETFDISQRVALLSFYSILQSLSNVISPYVNDILTNFYFRINYLFFTVILTFLFILSLFLIKPNNK